MRNAIESIQRRLEAQQVRGTDIREIQEQRPFLVFFKRMKNVGMELRVPFEHRGHDNRTVPDAVRMGRYPPNERLQRLVNDHLANQSMLHRGKNWQVRLLPWEENGNQLGYRAEYRQRPAVR